MPISGPVLAIALGGVLVFYAGKGVVTGAKAVGHGAVKVVHAVVHRTVKHPLGKTPESEKK